MKNLRDRGVTIVEITVALGVLGALFVLGVSVFERIQRMGDDVKCVSNLRQIGLGILAYANDHDGYLPGPLNSAQYPYWNHYTQLSKHLADYLNLDKIPDKRHHDDVFTCPAYKRALRQEGRKVGDTAVYTINILVPMGNPPTSKTPFGYANSLYPQVFKTTRDFPPMPLLRLADITDQNGAPAQCTTWLMKDIDYDESLRSFINGSDRSSLLKQKVHSDHRNALFYDLHVASVDFDSKFTQPAPDNETTNTVSHPSTPTPSPTPIYR